MRAQSARPSYRVPTAPSGGLSNFDESKSAAGNLHVAVPLTGSRAILDSLPGSQGKTSLVSSSNRSRDHRPSPGKQVSLADHQVMRTSSRPPVSERNDPLRSSAPARPGSSRSQGSSSRPHSGDVRQSVPAWASLGKTSGTVPVSNNQHRPSTARAGYPRSSQILANSNKTERVPSSQRASSARPRRSSMQGQDSSHKTAAASRPVTPSKTVSSNKMLGPLDFTFFELEDVADIPALSTMPNISPGKQRPLPSDRYTGLLLGNNNLKTIKDLPEVAASLLTNPPEQVKWLDLSFNGLTSIDNSILSFPNISVLYLHGNQIEQLDEVKKLSKLRFLRRLTLNGNPIAEQKTYRITVAAWLPNIRILDFTAITLMDRDKAQVWSDAMSGVFKPKRKEKTYGASY